MHLSMLLCWEQLNLEQNAGITTPNTPVKVSTDTQYLLVVANPGTVLQARLDNIANGATFNDINALITVTTKSGEANNSYLVDEVVHAMVAQ